MACRFLAQLHTSFDRTKINQELDELGCRKKVNKNKINLRELRCIGEIVLAIFINWNEHTGRKKG